MNKLILLALFLSIVPCLAYAKAPNTIYYYTIKDESGKSCYDDSIAVACFQGILNKNSAVLWTNAQNKKLIDNWKETLSSENRWLTGKKWVKINTLDELREFAGKKVKGAVIWDPAVPATVNVATTIAGVEDLVVLSPEMAEKYLDSWRLTVKHDLRGKFTGSETGSAKNDAYRWAVREYLAKGKCSNKFMFLYEDSWFKEPNDYRITYAQIRDWAIANKGFVFDLSPWGDETPQDDPSQPLGTDLATYELILKTQLNQTNGKCFTEMVGFFNFAKYSSDGGGNHAPIPTEWRTVALITPYNCFQNTLAISCYNQSFHKYFNFKNLKQKIDKNPKVKLENKTYICIFMADYDSTTTIYEFLPKVWADPRRGNMPLSWGINPNLADTYPDIISYYYETATPNDYFVADATCAGYFNPTRIDPKYMDLFVKHNQKYYKKLDMNISPMVLDVQMPTPLVKDAFTKFSKTGMGLTVSEDTYHSLKKVQPEIWKDMPIVALDSLMDYLLQGDFEKNKDYREFTQWFYDTYLKQNDGSSPSFYYLRTVWTSPSQVIAGIEATQKAYPNANFEIVDPYTFFNLQREYYKTKN